MFCNGTLYDIYCLLALYNVMIVPEDVHTIFLFHSLFLKKSSNITFLYQAYHIYLDNKIEVLKEFSLVSLMDEIGFVVLLLGTDRSVHHMSMLI